MLDLSRLHEAIHAVCPINGVSVGIASNKTTWKFDATASATDAQKVAAQAVINAFDIALVPDALDAWDIITLKIAFNHENRIRALEGKAGVTVNQFKNAVKALL